MATRIKTGPKVVGIIALLALVFFGGRYLYSQYAPTKAAEVPKAANLPAMAATSAPLNVTQTALPTSAPFSGGTDVRWDLWAWNAQMGMMFANGGPDTTQGSLMAQHGLNVHITREDDTNKMGAQLIALAKGLQKDPNTKDGVHFITLMGDGTAAFFAGINPELAKVCKDCTAEVVGFGGKSSGEDALMGPAEWKTNPKLAMGSVIAGVIRDGDWNVAMKWAADNGIKNNPDETTYDESALNWVNADTYIEAGNKFIANGSCETRRVVSNGKPTGDKKEVCVNAVVTWTPGDVNVASKKGGLVRIVSTKEYSTQMPCAIIGIKAWDKAHPAQVAGMLQAIFDGGDQVRSFPTALSKAAEISAAVYKEETGAYWEKYYKGVTEPDATHALVQLGGSSVFNLADNLQFFGLAPGSANLFEATYTVFGDIVVQQYPKLVPNYPKVADVANTSFVQDVAAHSSAKTTAELPQFNAATGSSQVVSKKSWQINFQTGSATFSPDSKKQLDQLKRDLLVADNLRVTLDGHTDNTGDPTANVDLSKRRAQAVRDYLMGVSADNFPESRFTVTGHGDKVPVGDNATDAGRARNRRVDVTLATN